MVSRRGKQNLENETQRRNPIRYVWKGQDEAWRLQSFTADLGPSRIGSLFL